MISLSLITLFISTIRSSEPSVPSAGCGIPGYTPDSTTKYFYTHGGLEREYIVHIPTTYDKDIEMPVIFSLPGYDTTPDRMSTEFGFQEQANAEGFMVVVVGASTFEDPMANYTHQTWNDLSCSNARCVKTTTVETWESWYGAPPAAPVQCSDGGIVIEGKDYYNACNWCDCRTDDIGFLKELTQVIQEDYCVDITRQYIMGFSAGGMMTQRMACRANDIFAGAVAFHGQMHITHNCRPFHDDYPIPYLNIWSDEDPYVPAHSGMDVAGWRYLTISQVQRKMALFNGCRRINKADGINEVVTVADGINGWTCNAYNVDCDNDAVVMNCGRNGNHSYPIDNPSNPGHNYGLEVAWDFLSQYQRITLV